MDKLAQKKEILKEVLVFLLKFNIFLVPFYLIIILDVDFYPLQIFLTRIIGNILSKFGYEIFMLGFFIYVEGLAIDISRDCIGWKSSYSLFALVMASPGKLKEKLFFVLRWIPLLFFINILRILITIIVGIEFGIKYLDFLHRVFWQELTILIVLGVWYFWIRQNRNEKSKTEARDKNIKGKSNNLNRR